MTEITQAQLDEWQALADAATPGTWRVESNTALVWGACDLDDQSSYGMGYPVASADLPPAWKKTNPTAEEMFANAAFIAASRTAVPALIAAFRESRMETERIRGLINHQIEGEPCAYFTLAKERDEATARAEKAEDMNREAVKQIGAISRELGELKGKQDAMQFVGLLDEWREKCAGLEDENARFREALSELTDLMQGVIDGDYTPDSFTLQPARDTLGKDKP